MDEQDEQGEQDEQPSEPSRSPEYKWAADADEERRAFIFEHMANADISGDVLIANMQRAFRWLKHGIVPKPQKRKLAVVQPSEVE